ncbi:hypothetical protein Tco_0485225 [Tanacetum coccineum]
MLYVASYIAALTNALRAASGIKCSRFDPPETRRRYNPPAEKPAVDPSEGPDSLNKTRSMVEIRVSVRYKPVKAFKTDLEGSPPEATNERCKEGFLLATVLAQECKRQGGKKSMFERKLLYFPDLYQSKCNGSGTAPSAGPVTGGDVASIISRVNAYVVFETKDSAQASLAHNMAVDTFFRNKNEDAHEHVERVLDIVKLFNIPGVSHDAVMLRVFPITLTGAAKRWVDRLPPGTVDSWDLLKKAFIQRYCPPSKIAKQLEEIYNFKQEGDETLYQVWERYNNLLYRCHTHDINNHQKVNIFYNGLGALNRQLLDSQRLIPGMTSVQALTAIQTMADHSQKWHDGSSSRNIYSSSNSKGIAAIVNKLENLGRDMKKQKENVHAIQLNPRNVTLPCTIGSLNFYAMADLGASINVIPNSIFKHLELAQLKKTDMLVEMADMIKRSPVKIVENVLVKIDKFLFPSDFAVMDMLNTRNETMILERPFLATIHADINVFNKEISLGIGGDRVTFDMDKKIHNFTTPIREIYMINATSNTSSDALSRVKETNDVHNGYNQEQGRSRFLYKEIGIRSLLDSYSCGSKRILESPLCIWKKIWMSGKDETISLTEEQKPKASMIALETVESLKKAMDKERKIELRIDLEKPNKDSASMVTVTLEATSKTKCRHIRKCLIEQYKASHLGNRGLAYDGNKSTFTAGSLPFENKEFVIVVPEKYGYIILLQLNLFNFLNLSIDRLRQFLTGTQHGNRQETIQALDIVLREAASTHECGCILSFREGIRHLSYTGAEAGWGG